ncbi:MULTISPECIES: efflux transporter outer membrane subunit [unclassified Janthinobacterium]|uniref:efflux transporter outer membrane subunit n=1 Tax=unclassified Janthinobacterium TaxID=2610881 RepID=UPI001610B76B|nr:MULTISPECIES: efflux transporter outer membrane subunit [unclassified Janthinobacterium]MBB5369422.1 NodT family efflux transporter outer membrane factor (OMF) lipoprotein [Janthinobacterium sp. K2C7]MBB5381042.1 NodT family efflux transporter outer membrane factor (OMF) lipoprotein [Janthinobacterium sp. K2Li3]MBB5387805.1 NodT family efflux transporter outer membrane factor (OMF) lipoprotein [Janthinobacterium sp. K2E3]
MKTVTLLFVTTLGLAGCGNVGHDFQRPQAALGTQWLQADGPHFTALQATAAEQRWWDSFGDATLSSLVQRAASSNLAVQAAASRLEQSRAARGVAGAAQAPSLSANGAYSRARNSGQGLIDASGLNGQSAYNLWQTNLDASWELDLWGRVRREVEAADARTGVAQEQQRGVLLAVMAETARDYIELRGAQQTLAITERLLAIARRTQELSRIRRQLGAGTDLDIAEAAAHVATIEARLPPLQQHETRLVNAISLLLALPPQALQTELAAAGKIPFVAMPVQLGVPGELAERRPDIRAAEAQLHAATAAIGVAQGDFYPRITLSGSVGLQTMQLSDIGWDAKSFAFGPGFSLPLFDGGRLRGSLLLREAQQQEAAIAYRQTVLAAWHEVEDALSAYQAQERRQASLDEAVRQGRRALQGAELQYQQGSVDLMHVLQVQNALLANEAALVDSRAAASLSLVAVYKALGGGWEVVN